MILSLHIENIAVVKSLDIDMREGFCVLTGETGAGKSIIIDCLGLLGGARSDKELIRSGETRGEVAAVFGNINAAAQNLIRELGFSSEDGTLMLSRTVFADAPSQARLNGRLISLTVLREISAALFNIHGQNDNQALLDRKNHLALLDRFAGCDAQVGEYYGVYKEILRLRCEIDSLNRDVMESERMREVLQYQIKDIESAKLKVGEEEALEAELKKLQSAEQIQKSASFAERAILGGERGTGASYLVERAAAALSKLSGAVPEADALVGRLTDIKYELDDIAAEAASLAGDIDGDPTARIDKIEGRLAAISKLRRKYGADIGEILAFAEEAVRKLDMIENSEDEIAQREEELKELSSRAREMALSIRAARAKAARELTERVTESLEFLDMPKVRFKVDMRPSQELLPRGLDEVEFLISTNVGEGMMPLIKIASGGELARIMLSIKDVLNECDGIDTAIFDEIDTGISGRTSRRVGIKLREISRGTQVVCVTHSAQIASLASAHYFITKSEDDGRVRTSVRELDYDGRVEEIARILGGIEISEIQRSAAREMIEEVESYE